MAIEVIQDDEFVNNGIYANRIIHNTRVDFVSRNTIVPPVHVVQYDAFLPLLAIKLYKNGEEYAIPSIADAKIRFASKIGETYIFEALGCSEDKKTLYFEVNPRLCDTNGTFYPVVEISIENMIAGASSFDLVVHPSPNKFDNEISFVIECSDLLYVTDRYPVDDDGDPIENVIVEEYYPKKILLNNGPDSLKSSNYFRGVKYVYDTFMEDIPEDVPEDFPFTKIEIIGEWPKWIKSEPFRYFPYKLSDEELRKIMKPIRVFGENSLYYRLDWALNITSIYFDSKPEYLSPLAGGYKTFQNLQNIYCNWDYNDTDPIDAECPWGIESAQELVIHWNNYDVQI